MPTLLLALGILFGDIIHLKNGGKLEGVVIHDKGDEVVVRLKYATVELDRSEIASIDKKADPAAAAAGAGRLPRWDRCIEVGRSKEWEGKWQQVPALVVEEGPLKNVPYMSFRSGNYEFNLYGDPDAPCGVEIGIYKDLLTKDAAKKQCIEAMADLLGDAKDKEIVKGLGFAAVKKDREGFAFEITPETAPDAYGGWWVSVYDLAGVEKARASQEELDRITATREEMEKLEKEAKDAEKKRRDAEAKAKAEAKKEAQLEKEEERRRAQEEAAQQNAIEPTSGYSNYDDYWVGWAMYRNWNWNGTRPIRPVRPGVRPPHVAPRYYAPGYSRGGGGYRAGPRVGGLRRR